MGRPAFDRLREMLNHVKFPNVEETLKNGALKHEMKRGISKAYGLLYLPEIACADWFNAEGTMFPIHKHVAEDGTSVKEWLIVYEGLMEFTMYATELDDGKMCRIQAGESIVIPAGALHSAFFPVDTHCLAIVSPAVPDWPNVGVMVDKGKAKENGTERSENMDVALCGSIGERS